MPKHQLVISPSAKADLKAIYQYSLQHWGKAQSERYLHKLKQHVWSLAEQPLIGIERSECLHNVRSLKVESHTLFYKVTNDNVEIIRVLHSRQDPQRNFI